MSTPKETLEQMLKTLKTILEYKPGDSKESKEESKESIEIKYFKKSTELHKELEIILKEFNGLASSASQAERTKLAAEIKLLDEQIARYKQLYVQYRKDIVLASLESQDKGDQKSSESFEALVKQYEDNIGPHIHKFLDHYTSNRSLLRLFESIASNTASSTTTSTTGSTERKERKRGGPDS